MIDIHLHVRNHLQDAKENSIDLRRQRGGVSRITGDIIAIKETGKRPYWWDQVDTIDHHGHYTVSPNMMRHQTLLEYIRGCDFVTVHK